MVKDYIYRGRSLLAVRDQDGDYSDFGLDHLGTIRVATNLFGELGSLHTYFPFGRGNPTGPGHGGDEVHRPRTRPPIHPGNDGG
ncbi:MAG: hypothetical protein R2862_02935 [Thermoanaerobaculia bacterium]